MVLAARRYYIDDVSKVQIADELGLSRFKVARLLEQARQTGVVTIAIQADGLHDPALSARLCEHLGLDKVTVIETSGDADAVRPRRSARPPRRSWARRSAPARCSVSPGAGPSPP